MLNKYRLEANLAKQINSTALHNTFAVKLCAAGVSYDKLTAILGITYGDSIQRYTRAAQTIKSANLENSLDILDKRRWWQKLQRSKPPALPINPEKPTAVASKKTPILGRDKLISNIRRHLESGQSVLIIGEYGLGKTALLKLLDPGLPEGVTSLKSLLQAKAEQNKLNSSGTIQDLATRLQEQVIAIDDLDKARKETLDFLTTRLNTHTFLCAAEKITPKMERLKNHLEIYKLEQLPDEIIREICLARLAEIAVSEGSTLPLLQRIIENADGNPGITMAMLNRLSKYNRVTAASMDDLYIEHPGHDRDWSSGMFVLISLVIGLRFVSRGMHDTELYVLSGLIYSGLYLMRGIRLRR